MIKITDFCLEHLSLLDDYQDLLGAYKDCPEGLNWYTNGPAYTAYDEEGIICIGGLCLQGGGLALAWSIPTPRIKKYPIYITKIAKWIIKIGMEELGLRKIFAHIAVDDRTAFRWAQLAGLKLETQLKQHNHDGKDVYLFSIIKEN